MLTLNLLVGNSKPPHTDLCFHCSMSPHTTCICVNVQNTKMSLKCSKGTSMYIFIHIRISCTYACKYIYYLLHTYFTLYLGIMYSNDYLNMCVINNLQVYAISFLKCQDLALGVADLHTPDALLAAERLVGGRASVVETNADSDTEESETEEDDKKNILQCGRTKRPKIEALN